MTTLSTCAIYRVDKKQYKPLTQGNEMKLIKKATKKETYGNKPKQDTMRKLSNQYNAKVFYMPYGKEGKGFYINP